MSERSSVTTNPARHEILTFRRQRFGAMDARGAGWWGTVTLIATEACLFAYLLFSYYYMAFHYGRIWLPAELPGFRLSGPRTALLLLSSVTVWLGQRQLKRGSSRGAAAGFGATMALGAVFMIIQLREWMEKPFRPDADSYGSLYFTITGFHMAHVAAGLLILAPLTLWLVMGRFDRRRRDPVTIGANYWQFVDAVWLTVFFTFYVTPYLFQT
jgi:heme/copper-type cytochrome/quinol oxidase subunit 3